MDVLIPLAAILAVMAGAVVWRIREALRMRDSRRDDTIRAGDAITPAQAFATRRAQGTQAWTRMSDPSGP